MTRRAIWDDFGDAWCIFPGSVVIERHGLWCQPGKWRVGIFGWDSLGHAAVVDDFGNLIRVS